MWQALRAATGRQSKINRYASKKETPMAWKTPKIVELPVGLEINMYACAARK